jgi:lambda family phage portal protein
MAPRKTAATAPDPAMKTSVPRLSSVKFKPGFGGSDKTQGLRAMYEAAGQGRRAVDAFKQANGWSAEYLLGKTLDVVQRRVLHEVRNNPIAGRIVDVIVRTTIGTGLVPKISDPVLRKLWKRWCKQAGADGRLTFDGLMSLAMREVAVKGEVFLRHRERELQDVKDGYCSLPYQVQLVTSEFCPLTRPGEVLSTDPADDFRSGIFFNPNIARREAYLFLTKHPRGGTVAALSDTAVVPASKVMHVFQDREGGQLRGEPWLVRSIIRLHELDEYMDAELAKKKSAAKLTTKTASLLLSKTTCRSSLTVSMPAPR